MIQGYLGNSPGKIEIGEMMVKVEKRVNRDISKLERKMDSAGDGELFVKRKLIGRLSL